MKTTGADGKVTGQVTLTGSAAGATPAVVRKFNIIAGASMMNGAQAAAFFAFSARRRLVLLAGRQPRRAARTHDLEVHPALPLPPPAPAVVDGALMPAKL